VDFELVWSFVLKEAVCSHMNTRSTFHKALLLVVLKMLGLAVWIMGGSLLVLILVDTTTAESQENRIWRTCWDGVLGAA
jgi:hypothetical protein